MNVFNVQYMFEATEEACVIPVRQDEGLIAELLQMSGGFFFLHNLPTLLQTKI